jgi:hypothetical protein
MPSVFWIEDEAYLLGDTRTELEALKGVSRVAHFGDASGAWKSLGQIKADGGPIILDLWIPPGAAPLPPIPDPFPARFEGPGVGLHLLHLLRTGLGVDWPIFVVSGNLTLFVNEHLTDKLGIDRERIIRKPLNDKRQEGLLRAIQAELSRLAQPRPPGGAARGPGASPPAP